MIVQGKIALRHIAFGWPMVFALCFMATLIAGTASAVESDFLNQAQTDTPDINEAVTAAPHHHEMKTSVRLCENPNCETNADCGMTCSMSGGCTSTAAVGPTTLSHAVAPLGTLPLVAFTQSTYCSRQLSSLLRPPIR